MIHLFPLKICTYLRKGNICIIDPQIKSTDNFKPTGDRDRDYSWYNLLVWQLTSTKTDSNLSTNYDIWENTRYGFFV